jgi:hypothetical protein
VRKDMWKSFEFFCPEDLKWKLEDGKSKMGMADKT